MSVQGSERWERISSLFAAARALEDGERKSFLTLACGADDTLRDEVEALLAADTPDDGFLEDPPWLPLAESVGSGMDPVRLSTGQMLCDRYRIDSEFAAGGQAVVYLAHDQHLMMRPVVIKVMRAEGHRNRWLKSRFEREMEALSRIDHPGVVGILDVGELDDGSPFLVIQHIPGMSLRELLAQGPIPPARAAGILRQIGSALSAAHAAGIAHRDLKPENIMLQQRNDGADIVRLIDFGIAKIDRPEHDSSAVVVGTVRYMAPEQFEGIHSGASDIYAMALVACEMLSGHPDSRALAASTSKETRSALEAALAFRAAERPSDVQAWSESLARSLMGDRHRVRRRIGVGVALSVLALAAVATIEWSDLGDPAEPARIVEKVGAFDPVTEGFEAHDDVTSSGVEDNPTYTGYDAWRVTTVSRGLYLYPISDGQRRRALERGWTLTVEMKAEEGVAYSAVEFTPDGPGFPIQVFAEGDREIVRLPTQVVPELRGIEFVQDPPGAYHRYELIYDPVLETADLWVDGERRLTGYRGWAQNTYRLDAGVLFGTAVYRNERASGTFRSVRFVIHP